MDQPDIREIEFLNAMLARTRELREAKGWNQEQMAIALGVSAHRYRKYETRSVLPPYLMQKFCLITECDLEYFLTGKRTAAAKKARRTALAKLSA